MTAKLCFTTTVLTHILLVPQVRAQDDASKVSYALIQNVKIFDGVNKELKPNDVGQMIDELIGYKKSHYPNDRRRILVGGILDGKIHVQWLPPAAPGVDPQWETRLYGLVKTGDRMGAIRFLQTTRKMSRLQAAKRVDRVAADLRMA